MRLTDLEPRWLTPNYFVFRCPCCRTLWLGCKNIVMTDQQQLELLEKEFGEELHTVAGARNDYAWNFQDSGDFETLTVTPSIDASKSGGGHWHGNITNGQTT